MYLRGKLSQVRYGLFVKPNPHVMCGGKTLIREPVCSYELGLVGCMVKYPCEIRVGSLCQHCVTNLAVLRTVQLNSAVDSRFDRCGIVF